MNDIWDDDEERFAAEYESAQETARELVTILKWLQQEGNDDDAHVSGAVREATSGYVIPRQYKRLIEVLALAVANTFPDLADWSEHVVRALAEDGDAS